MADLNLLFVSTALILLALLWTLRSARQMSGRQDVEGGAPSPIGPGEQQVLSSAGQEGAQIPVAPLPDVCGSELLESARLETRQQALQQQVAELEREKASLTQQRELYESRKKEALALEGRVKELADACERYGRQAQLKELVCQQLCEKKTQLERELHQLEVRESHAIVQKNGESKVGANGTALEKFEAANDRREPGLVPLKEGQKAFAFELADLQNSLAELAVPVLQSSGLVTSDSEEEVLARAQARLGAGNGSFPFPAFLAMHTSLKLARSSALTLVQNNQGATFDAIRGCARASGIHTISAKVHASWSETGQMLGLYHYLERRFRPTELCRALAQISPCSAEDLPGLPLESRADEMLIVLLESAGSTGPTVFFADLLTRLVRSRQHRNPDAAVRGAIGWEIPVGALPEGERPRLIYPGQNVIFIAGVDQQLASKLRHHEFAALLNWWPAQMELSAFAASDQVESAPPIASTAYGSWIKSVTALDELPPMLSSICETLQEIFTAIGAPLNHSQLHHLFSYVSNYPGSLESESRLKEALATYLRGVLLPLVELSASASEVCFSSLEEVLSRLGDPCLLAEFQESRREPVLQ